MTSGPKSAAGEENMTRETVVQLIGVVVAIATLLVTVVSIAHLF
jgi:hypothetical protein